MGIEVLFILQKNGGGYITPPKEGEVGKIVEEVCYGKALKDLKEGFPSDLTPSIPWLQTKYWKTG